MKYGRNLCNLGINAVPTEGRTQSDLSSAIEAKQLSYNDDYYSADGYDNVEQYDDIDGYDNEGDYDTDEAFDSVDDYDTILAYLNYLKLRKAKRRSGSKRRYQEREIPSLSGQRRYTGYTGYGRKKKGREMRIFIYKHVLCAL